MEKNAALAMFLIFGLWMVYITVFAPKPDPAAQQLASSAVEQTTRAPVAGTSDNSQEIATAVGQDGQQDIQIDKDVIVH